MKPRQNNTQDKTATAYVVTFPPKKNTVGHSSLYVESDDGEVIIERSFYPSSKSGAKALRQYSARYAPVPGFSTTMEKTASYEEKPISIQKISGLNLQAMLDENNDFTTRTENNDHVFSSAYQHTLNPLNTIYKHTKALSAESENRKKSGKMPSLTLDDPMTGSVTVQADVAPTISMGNCADAVERSLEAGGYQKPAHSYTSSLWSFFTSSRLKPATLQKELAGASAKEIINTQEVPAAIQKAISSGQDIAEMRRQLKCQQPSHESDEETRRHFTSPSQ